MKSPATCIAIFLLLGVSACAAGETAVPGNAAAPVDFPSGWVPVNKLDDKPAWPDFRKIEDKVHLYLPENVPVVRGVFVCYVFHSSDPRELARLWKFALVTVPWPFEYDLGYNDKRNGRFKLGHSVGNMGVLLNYLNVAAKESNHPELAVAPIVGWLGQNGATMCSDLFKRAPERTLAWGDAWYQNWPKYPDMIAKVPVASAWEFDKNAETGRRAEREKILPQVKDKPTPPGDLRCYASTYGFGHGIYSKYSFFVAYMDRCIKLRLLTETPPAGQPVKLRDIEREKGWVGDFNEIGEFCAIAPVAEAKGMVAPMWMPDAYAAWMWRSYHSAKPAVKLTAPVIEYSKNNGKWGGPECGLGYHGELNAGEPLRFAASAPAGVVAIEFHDGDTIVGKASAAPWEVKDVKLAPGLHTLFAVSVMPDGTRQASRPAFAIVD